MRHGTFPRLRQSLNLWHPVFCQSSHILPETFMISTLTMSIIKKMRAFLLAISFKYYKLKGGYRDSNPGPPEPQSGALTNCAIPTIGKMITHFPTCPKGFEPPTHGLEGRCSIQLSYGHTLRRIALAMSTGLLPEKRLLDTVEAGDGNRTHVSSLEGWCSTIELHLHIV